MDIRVVIRTCLSICMGMMKALVIFIDCTINVRPELHRPDISISVETIVFSLIVLLL